MTLKDRPEHPVRTPANAAIPATGQAPAAPAPAPATAPARTGPPAASHISSVALALMTTASVASLRAAPSMAVYGLMGVEEPLALIHAPNESVDPTEIANMAVAEAIFLQRYGAR